jgi:hypothetical protein
MLSYPVLEQERRVNYFFDICTTAERTLSRVCDSAMTTYRLHPLGRGRDQPSVLWNALHWHPKQWHCVSGRGQWMNEYLATRGKRFYSLLHLFRNLLVNGTTEIFHRALSATKHDG